MFIDNQLMFSDGQDLTASAASTNVIDLQSTGIAQTSTGGFQDFLGGSRLMRFANGEAETLTIYIQFGWVAGSPTIIIDFQGSVDAAFTSPVSIEKSNGGAALTVTPVANPSNSAFTMNPNFQKLGYRYYRLNYTIGGTATHCVVTAGFVLDAQTANPTMQTY
jgi:hypothetical protein